MKIGQRIPGDYDTRDKEPVCTTCWLQHPAGACDRDQ